MPNNWKTYKLSDALEIKYGKDHKKVQDGTIPIYGTGGIMRYGNQALYDKATILIPRKGSLNNIFYLNEPFWSVDTIFWSKINEDVAFPKYLFYNLKVLDFASMDVGSAIPSLTTELLKKIEIELPSLQEQQSITAILSAIDDKIENNLAINKTLEEMAMALYKHWFVDFGPFQDGKFVESELGRIPKGWEVLCLDDVSTLTAGGDKPKKFSNVKTDECKIPIYSNGITNDGLYGFTDTARINEESITVSARGTIGFVCLRQEPYLPIVRLIAVVPNQDFVTSKYLFYWLKTQNINGNGTTQQQLTVPDFKVTKVLVPKLEIINKFTDIINPYYDEINSNSKENQTLTQLRDTLLPKLISGEVRLKEFRE